MVCVLYTCIFTHVFLFEYLKLLEDIVTIKVNPCYAFLIQTNLTDIQDNLLGVDKPNPLKILVARRLNLSEAVLPRVWGRNVFRGDDSLRLTACFSKPSVSPQNYLRASENFLQISAKSPSLVRTCGIPRSVAGGSWMIHRRMVEGNQKKRGKKTSSYFSHFTRFVSERDTQPCFHWRKNNSLNGRFTLVKGEASPSIYASWVNGKWF